MDCLTAIFDERIAFLRMEAVWWLSEPKEGWIQLPVVSSGLFKLSEMKIFLFAWSRLEWIFCHLHLEEFWQIQVSKEENHYSGISSGFCSQWNRVMLAILVFKTFLQILKTQLQYSYLFIIVSFIPDFFFYHQSCWKVFLFLVCSKDKLLVVSSILFIKFFFFPYVLPSTLFLISYIGK